MNLSVLGLALAQRLYVALIAAPPRGPGTHSLIMALAPLPDVDWVARSS
jgi:hypothetical protein